MPSHLKGAHVRPVLEKPSLETAILNNHIPVSNLLYLSKIIERVVAVRRSAHMSDYTLSEPYRSAYRPNHNIETALVCEQNYILLPMDNGQNVVIVVLLYLSAAFDTVDQEVMLHRFSHNVGAVQNISCSSSCSSNFLKLNDSKQKSSCLIPPNSLRILS